MRLPCFLFIPEDIWRVAQTTEEQLKIELALLLYKHNNISRGKV